MSSSPPSQKNSKNNAGATVRLCNVAASSQRRTCFEFPQERLGELAQRASAIEMANGGNGPFQAISADEAVSRLQPPPTRAELAQVSNRMQQLTSELEKVQGRRQELKGLMDALQKNAADMAQNLTQTQSELNAMRRRIPGRNGALESNAAAAINSAEAAANNARVAQQAAKVAADAAKSDPSAAAAEPAVKAAQKSAEATAAAEDAAEGAKKTVGAAETLDIRESNAGVNAARVSAQVSGKASQDAQMQADWAWNRVQKQGTPAPAASPSGQQPQWWSGTALRNGLGEAKRQPEQSGGVIIATTTAPPRK